MEGRGIEGWVSWYCPYEICILREQSMTDPARDLPLSRVTNPVFLGGLERSLSYFKGYRDR